MKPAKSKIKSKLKTQSNSVSKYQVTSLDKALSVLELILDYDRNFSITEIGQKLGMPKGTVHRVLSTLAVRNFIQQNSKTKLYGLGVRTLEIGMAPKRERYLRVALAPFLMDLYDICGETVNAALWEYNAIRYIYRLESEEMLRVSTTAIARYPGYCSATGKIFLSYLINEDIRRIYGKENAFKKCTENSISSIDMLIAEIEKVRNNKVAIDNEESLSGVYCVAAPILNSKGECVAAISISAPKDRMDEKRSENFLKLISETARKCSNSLNTGSQYNSYNLKGEDY